MRKKLLKSIIIALIIIIAFVTQSTLSLVNAQNVATPNLLLIVTCMFGFIRGRNYGCVIGLFCGLMVDIFFADIVGLYALIYMYIGFFSGIFRKIFYSDHIFMPMLLVFCSDFMYNLACYVFRFLLRNKLDFTFYFQKIFFPEMVITTFLAFVLYKLFYILNEKVFIQKQESTLSFDK